MLLRTVISRFLLFTVCLVIGFTGQVNAWWNAAWHCRQEVSFRNQAADSSLYDFPVLVKLYNGRIDYSLFQTTGEDLRFVDADDATVLDHEIESWDVNGTSYVWVEVPKIDSQSNVDSIWMYYNNKGAADGQDTAGTWNAGFEGVWHFGESGTGTRYDATSNSNDGTPANYDGDEKTTGPAGAADYVDGTNDYVSVADAPFDLTDDFSVSAWVKTGAANDDWARIIDKLNRWDSGWGIGGKNGAGYGFVAYWTPSVWGGDPAAPMTGIGDNAWHYISAVVEGGVAFAYVDGVRTATYNTQAGGTISQNNNNLVFGKSSNLAAYWSGSLDEVRISSVVRDSFWIYAEHASMIDTFITWSALEKDEYLPPDNDMTLTATALSETSIALSWNPAVIDSADAYRVGIWYKTGDYPDSASDPTATLAGYHALNVSADTVLNGLIPNTTYYFIITVTDSSGNWADTTGAASAAVTTPFKAWYQLSWLSRQQLTFKNQAASVDLTNMPVLVKLATGRIDYTKTENDGSDLRFVAADNQTLLDYEIETWNEAGTSYVWVEVPTISAGINTDYIWMYYNNSAAGDAADTAGTWSNGYQGVWHLNETGTGTRYDATSNNYDGTPANYDNDEAWTGRMAGADSLDGVNDYINLGDVIKDPAQLTISAWFKVPSLNGTHEAMITKGDNSYALKISNGNNVQFFIYDTGWRTVNSDASPSTGQFVYATGTWDGTNVRMYVNGVLQAAANTATHINSTTYPLYFGENSQAAGRDFGGVVDEVRIASTARSGSWIYAQHASMIDTFIDWGSASEEGADTLPPDNDGILTARTLDDGTRRIELSWQPGSIDSADAYRAGIWYTRGGASAYPDSADEPGVPLAGFYALTDSVDTLQFGFAAADDTIYFSLLFRDSSGNWSDTAVSACDTAVVFDSLAPDNDVALTAQPRDKEIVLSWTPGSIDSVDADSMYLLYKIGDYPDSVDDGTATLLAKYGDVTTAADTLHSTLRGSTYYFMLFVRDTSGNWSDSLLSGGDNAVPVDTLAPDNDVSLNVVAGLNRSILLSWTPGNIDSTDADSMAVWYKIGDYPDSAYDVTATLLAKYSNVTTALDTLHNALPGSTYYFVLLVRDTSGNWSDTIGAGSDNATAVSPPFQTIWTGLGGTTDWNTAANWDNGIPDAVDTAFITAGTDSVVIGAAAAVCMRLVIGAGDTVSLAGGYDLDIGVSGVSITGVLNVTSTTSQINVAGSWEEKGSFVHGNSIVVFDSTGNATIDSTPTFYTLVISKDNTTDTVYASDPDTVTIDDSLAIVRGCVHTIHTGLTVQASGTGTDKLTMAAPGRLSIAGNAAFTFPVGFEDIVFDVASMVEYYSNATQIIQHQEADGDTLRYGNLRLTRIDGNNRWKQAGGGLDINGDMYVGDEIQFNAVSDSHTVAGDWTDDGDEGSTNFNGTIIFDGAGPQNISSNGDFSNIIFSGGNTVIITAINVDSNFYVTNNTVCTTSQTVEIRGDFEVDAGSKYVQSNNSTQFDGTGIQIIKAANATFRDLDFDNGAPNRKKVIGDLYALRNLIVRGDADVMDSLAGQSHTMLGNFQVDGECRFSGTVTQDGGTIFTNNADGMVSLPDSCDLVCTAGSNIQNGDTLDLYGNITITAGTFTINTTSHLLGHSGDTLRLSAGVTLQIEPVDGFPAGFDTCIMDAASTVDFDEAYDQTVRGNQEYGRLTLQRNTKTLDGPVVLNWDLNLNDDCTVQLGAFSHYFGEDLVGDPGSSINSTGSVTFSSGDNNITLDGDVAQTYNHLTITQSAPTAVRTKNIDRDITVNGSFKATNPAGSAVNYMIVDIDGNDITNDGGDSLILGDHVHLYTSSGNFQVTTTTFDTVILDTESVIRFDVGAANIPSGFTYGTIQMTVNGNKTALGNLDIDGDLWRSGNTPIFVDGGYHHTIAGDWNLGTGYYTVPAGTIEFDGADQAINTDDWKYVIFSGNGTKTLSTDMDVDSNLTIAGICTLDMNGNDIAIEKNFDNSGTGVIRMTSGNITFDGIGQQTVSSNAESYFYDFVVDKGGDTVVASTDLDINGDLTLTAQYFKDAGNTVKVATDLNNGSNYVASGTMDFDGGQQDVDATTFNNVTFSGNDTVILSGNITVNGNLTIAAGETLDVSGSGYDIDLAGSWTNNGYFGARNGQVTLTGNASDLTGNSGSGKGFYDLVLNKNADQRVTLTADLDVDNDFTITQGILRTDSYNGYFGGNFTNNDSLEHNNNSSSLNFDASSGTKTIEFGGDVPRDLVFNSAGALHQISSDLLLEAGRNITITAGRVDLNSNTVTMGGSGLLTIASGGSLYVADAETLYLGDDDSVKTAGIFSVVGSGGSPAVVTRTGGGGYTVNQTAGILHLRNYRIYYTKDNGLTVSGGSIDATNNFSNGTFANGAGNQYIELSGLNFSAFSCTSVTFNTGPTNNVKRMTGDNDITFVNSAGPLSGDNHENDGGTYINWDFFDGVFWDGGGDGLTWNDGTNWSTDVVPTAADTVNIILGTDSVILTGTANAVCRRLVIASGDTLTLKNGYDLDIDIGGLDLDGDMICGHAGSEITIAGSWDQSGTFTPGSGKVTFDSSGNVTLGSTHISFNDLVIERDNKADTVSGAGGITVTVADSFALNKGTVIIGASGMILQADDTGTDKFTMTSVSKLSITESDSFPIKFEDINLHSASTVEYYSNSDQTVTSKEADGGVLTYGNLELNRVDGNDRVKNADGPLDIDGAMTLSTEVRFADNGDTHTVAGSWTQGNNETKTDDPDGCIEFDGAGFQTVSGDATFNNLRITGGGTVNFANNFQANYDFTVTGNSTVNASNQVDIHRNFKVDTGSEYTQNNASTRIEGGTVQKVIIDGDVTFWELWFDNACTATVKGNIYADSYLRLEDGAVVYDSVAGQHHVTDGNFYINDGNTKCHFTDTITIRGGTIQADHKDTIIALPGSCLVRTETGAPAIQAGDTLVVYNNVHITETGGLYLGNNAALVGALVTDTVKVDSSGDLYVQGTDNFPTTFDTVIFQATSWARFNGNRPQNIPGREYANIRVDYDTKTVQGDMDIDGDLQLENNCDLVMGAFSHTIEDDVTGGGNSITSTGTVTFDGPDNDNDLDGDLTYTFNHLIYTRTAPTALWTNDIDTDITVNGSFKATNSGGSPATYMAIDIDGNEITNDGGDTLQLGKHVYLYTSGAGSFQMSTASFDTVILADSSTIRFDRNGAQNIPGGFTYGNLFLQQDGNKTAQADLDINGNVTHENGPDLYDGGYHIRVAGDWYLASGDVPAPAGTLTFDGADQIVNGGQFHHLTFGGTGTKTVTGNIFVLDDLVVNNGVTVGTGQYDVDVAGDFDNGGTGVFTQTAGGEVEFDGPEKQTVTSNTNSHFYDFRINKGANDSLVTGSDIVIRGDLHFDSNPDFVVNDDTVHVREDWNFDDGAELFANAGAVIHFNGEIDQDLQNDAGCTFSNVTFSGAGLKQLNDGIWDVDGDWHIKSGASVDDNGRPITVAGDWTNEGSFIATNTVTFNGAKQTIGASSFNDVTVNGSDTTTLAGNITLEDDLIIADGGVLDVSSSNYTVSLAGDWDNDQTGRFVPRNGTVIFTGNGKSLYSGDAGAGKSFWNLENNMTTGQTNSLQDSLDVNGDFTISNGTFQSNGNPMYIAGDFTNNEQFNNNYGAALITFDGVSGTTSIKFGDDQISDMVINAPGALCLLTDSINFYDNDELIITAGRLDMNGQRIAFDNNGGKMTVAASGTLEVDAGAELLLDNNDSLVNAGVLKVVGEEGNPATVARNGAAGGWVGHQTGGEIHALYYQFANTEGDGFTFSGGSIDSTNNFSEGTFTGGSGNQYLELSGLSFPAFTCSNVVFNAGPSDNVKRTTGDNAITFQYASGALAGSPYENDGASYINWTYPGGVLWDGGGDGTTWSDQANWQGDVKPTSSDIVVLEHSNVAGSYTVQISAEDAVAGRLILQGGASNIKVLTSGFDLDVDGNLEIGTDDTVTIGNANDTIRVAGSWVNAGIFNNGGGTVVFDDTTGSYSITSGGDAFHNVRLDSSGAIYELADDMDIDGNLDIDQGHLDASTGDRDIDIAGNWYNTGVNSFNPRNADVTFNKTGTDTQTIQGGPFNNFLTSNGGGGTATKIILTNIDIDWRITIGANTAVNGSTYTIYVGEDWYNNSASAAGFVQSGNGTVIFDRSGNQDINYGNTQTTFNNLILDGTNTKLLRDTIYVNSDLTMRSGFTFRLLVNTTVIGNGGSNTFTGSQSTLRLDDNNFPSGFETINFASNHTTQYRGNNDQDIYPTTYGDLLLRGDGSATTKTASGHITVQDDIDFNDDAVTTLDMDGYNLTLGDQWWVSTGQPDVIWKGGTFTHTGGDITIDADLNGFHTMVLNGSGTKTMSDSLVISGDVTVSAGVSFDMQTNVMVCTSSSRTFTLADGAVLDCATPISDTIAFPLHFDTYTLGANSTVDLDGGAAQEVLTTPVYGNLTFSNNSTMAMNGDLDVDGDFDMGNVTLTDNGNDLTLSGTNIRLTEHTAGAGCRITFDGTDQTVRDDETNAISFRKVVFGGSGTKTFTDNNDVIDIADSAVINSGVTVTTSRNWNISGPAFLCSGTFTQTANTLTFDGDTAQTIDMGSGNTIQALTFSGTGTKALTGSGVSVTDDFIISDACTVYAGALSHTVTDFLTIGGGGVLSSASSNFLFNGDGQTIDALTAADVTLTSTGTNTKTMNGDWSVDDLSIGSNTTLDVSGSDYRLSLTGDFLNSGTFTDQAGTVFFTGTRDTVDITTNGSNFYGLRFDPADTVVYRLMSSSNRVDESMTVNDSAELLINGTDLVLGRDAAGGKLYEVDGILNVDAGGALKFDNRNTPCSLKVNSGGKLRLVGSASDVATITRNADGPDAAETHIEINDGAEIEAYYYFIEYLSDSGMHVKSGAVIDTVYNFSQGTWANLNTATGSDKRYLVLDCASPESSITEVSFNFSGTPTAGDHYNVWRPAGHTDTITFSGNIGGALAGATYEFDPDSKVVWPPITSATWTGTIDRDWHTAGNWNPTTVPDSTVNVTIPLVTNNPQITTGDAACRDLYLSTGNLELGSARDLTVYGDVTIGTGNDEPGLAVSSSPCTLYVKGNWTRGNRGVFTHNDQPVVFEPVGAGVTIQPRTSAFQDVIFNASAVFSITGDMDIDGDMIIQAGTVYPATDNYDIYLAGDFINAGTFNNSTNGLVTLDGGNQSIAGANWDQLTVSGTNKKTFTGTHIIADDLILNDTMVTAAGCSLDMSDDVTINASGVWNNSGGGTHTFGGDSWYGYGGYIGTGMIHFDRTDWQDIYAGTFHNLKLDCTAGADLEGSITINGNLILTGNVDELEMNNYTITGTDTFFIEAGGDLRVEGPDNFPWGFAVYDFDSTCDVWYNGTMDQTVKGDHGDTTIVYGDLELDNATTKTLDGDITVADRIDFREATLDASADNHNITIGGYWDNDNTGTFVPRLSEVTFNGSGTQEVRTNLTGGQSFFKLTVDKTGGVLTFENNPQTISNNLTVTRGSVSADGRVITVGGDLLNNGGTIVSSGTFKLTSALATARIRSGGSELNNVTIDAGTGTYTAQDGLVLNGDLIVASGTFDGNGKTVDIDDGGHVVNISGTYKVGPGGVLKIDDASQVTVQTGGVMEVVGTVGSAATVTNDDAGDEYTFQVDGTIRAEYYVFEEMDVTGIYISASGTIDTTYNFSNGTFQNGEAGGTYLRVENGDTLTIDNVSFPDDPGAGATNVSKTVADSGLLTFTSPTGSFAGEDHDNDPNNLIVWPSPVTLTWTGLAGTDWHNAGNWSASSGPDKVPSADEDVVIATATNQPVISTSGAAAKSVTVNSGASLHIDAGDSIDLDIAQDMTVNGTFAMTAGDTVTVGGNWTVGAGATFTHGSATVILDAASGRKNIDNDVSAVYHLVKDSAGAYDLSDDITVSGDLTLNAGYFDVTTSDHDVTVAGSWFNNGGTFTPQDGVVTFTGTGTGSIAPGTSPFKDVVINGGTATRYRITGDSLNIDGNLTVSTGILDLNGKILNFGDGSGTDVLSVNDTLEVDGNASLELDSSAQVAVNAGGVVKVVGTDVSNVATVTRPVNAGNYSFSVNSGGGIQARYYLFEHMDTDGIRVKSGASVHAANNFSNGTFSNGPSGGRYLLLECNYAATDTVDSVTFNSGASVNVKRLAGTDTVVFKDPTGSRAWATYEDDSPDGGNATGRIKWVSSSPIHTWTGTNGTAWADDGNWDTGQPDGTKNAIIPDVSGGSGNNPLIDAGNRAVNSLTIQDGGHLEVDNNYHLTVNGGVVVAAAGTLEVDNGSVTRISVADAWTNEGAFITGGADTVELTAAAGIKQITNDGDPFHHLKINGSASYEAAEDLDIDGEFRIAAGTFDVTVNNYTLDVAGDWINDGTFTARAGTVCFNGGNGQTVTVGDTGTGKAFNILKMDKSGDTLHLAGKADVGNDLLLAGGTFDNGNDTLLVRGNWNNSGASFTGAAGGLVAMKGSGTHTMVTNNQSFINLGIRKTGGQITLNSNAAVTGKLNVCEGTLFLNSRDLSFGDGADSILVAGILNVDAGANLKMHQSAICTVTSSGTMIAVGTGDASRATVTALSGTAGWELMNNGTLQAYYADFAYSGGNGVSVTAAGAIHGTFDFDQCRFSNGTGTAYLTLANSQNMVMDSVRIDSALTGRCTYNIQSTAGSGSFVLNNNLGTFVGQTWENDDGGQVNPGRIMWDPITLKLFGTSKSPAKVWPNERLVASEVDVLLLKFYAQYDTIEVDSLVLNLVGGTLDSAADADDIDTVYLYTDNGSGSPGSRIAGAFGQFDSLGNQAVMYMVPTDPLVVPRSETLAVHVVFNIAPDAYPDDTLHQVAVSIKDGDSVRCRALHTAAAVFVSGAPITSDDMSLPVELSSFTATASVAGVELAWRTESETENMGFNVYRSSSADGPWSCLNPALVPGAWNSEHAHEYHYTDGNVLPGAVYWYRIADVTAGGLETLHEPVRVVIPVPGTEQAREWIEIGPNPVVNRLSVSCLLEAGESGSVVLYTGSGRPVMERLLAAANGRNEYRFCLVLDRLNNGIYIAEVRLPGLVKRQMIILYR